MSTDSLAIAVSGAAGRMGRELRRLIAEANDLSLAAALERPDLPNLDGEYVTDLSVGLARARVMVDFSIGEALPDLVAAAAEHKVAVVSGTTGFGAAGEAALDRAARRVPVVWAPNMSLGVNLLLALVEQVTAALPLSYDAEIVELHHRGKRDAPSGTALGLLNAIRRARPSGADQFGRQGNLAPRSAGEVAVHAVRGGEVVGEHCVHFLGDYERLELIHRAQSRAAFAQGALQAARWVTDQPPGRYTMRDVLGLSPGD